MRSALIAALLAQFITCTAVEVQTQPYAASWLQTQEVFSHEARDHSHNLQHRSHHFLNFALQKQETRLQKAEDEYMAALDAEAKGRPEHAPFFDAFWFAYWGTVAVITGVIWLLMNKQANQTPELGKRLTVAELVLGSARSSEGQEEDDGNDEDDDDDDDEEEGVDLPENTWALILIASIGQAKFPGGSNMPAWFVSVIAVFMGSIQLAALFLMCHDLDPTSEPYTVKPSTPYGSIWTVNSMKVIMTVFMVVALVSEAGQCNQVFCQAMAVHEKRLISPRWVPLVMEVIQYTIAIAVVWAGVSVILSFQAVPDIIYSSMSIMCISNVDEMFFEGMNAVLGIDANFTVKPSAMKKDSVYTSIRKGSADEEMKAKGDFHYELSDTFNFVMKFLLAFPVLLGVFLFMRAWYTGIMPTDRIRTIMEVLPLG